MNANTIIDDDMSLEDKLAAIDLAMANAQAVHAKANPGAVPLDPADALMCEGCQQVEKPKLERKESIGQYGEIVNELTPESELIWSNYLRAKHFATIALKEVIIKKPSEENYDKKEK